MLAAIGAIFYPLLAAAVVLGAVYVFPARWCTAVIAGVISALLSLLALRNWTAGANVLSSGGDALCAYLCGLAVAALILSFWPSKPQPTQD